MIRRVALAQINTTVGDLEGNTRKVLQGIDRARAQRVDLITFPELTITGYPPEDLLFNSRFISSNLECLERIVEATQGIIAVVGFVHREDDLYNAAAVLHDGRLAAVYHKRFLPNYGVFDEQRYFQAGTQTPVLALGDIRCGVSICEDIWYPDGPPQLQALAGDAELLVNISASPYHFRKGAFRERMLATRAADSAAIVVFTNLVGGQDELVFDGHSLIFDQQGELIARGKQFAEDYLIVDLDLDAVFRHRLKDPRRRQERLFARTSRNPVTVIDLGKRPQISPPSASGLQRPPSIAPLMDEDEEIYTALCLGIRDYLRKNGFQKVVIGISGGIDSSMVTAIAVDALGRENVVGVTMPSRYSSTATKTDACRLAENLGIKLLTIPIEAPFATYRNTLAPAFEGLPEDVTEENIQARIRGNILMALSNKFGWLVLTTGDKSEMSVGFATLYGDLSGGFAVIKDIYKTRLYQLARYRNQKAGRAWIPESILQREPSPELRPNQKASDTLPPYPVLDPILEAYVEKDMSVDEIVASGADRKLVLRILKMVDRSEYKRRQAPPGIKITPRALGKDRRLPITNRNVHH